MSKRKRNLSGMKWGELKMKFQMHQNNYKMKKKILEKKNHSQEQVEIDDLLKDMGIPIPSTQFNMRKPKTYEEAVKSNKAKQWKEAMQAEVESLENNDTWTFVDRPKDKNVLPGNGYTESNTVQMVKWTSTKPDMWRKATRKSKG